ncbi:MAG: hypothetical protein ACI9WH_000616, partial [Glaciecola sp.]
LRHSQILSRLFMNLFAVVVLTNTPFIFTNRVI